MKIKHFLFTTTLFCGSFAFTACSDNDDPSTDGGEGNSTTINITPSVIGEARNTTGVSPTNDESQAAINGYVDITVIPTYQILVQKATALQTAVNTLPKKTKVHWTPLVKPGWQHVNLGNKVKPSCSGLLTTKD